ncbi:UvrD-helicase domain-containing protein [Alkalihalobacillus pseudalcaliphilus]|uniref:UvrD-helicase domain-containing protein n=1 Tax=Alkalihalobacillus pseudalcaliphilus TaxID=79884 RepID=UPI00064DF093|nr:UvrD-helicase domain-containing protein [Alkalihalobacillus pseudalcaliphilus]KMK74730.1 hypothetical protein AB990_19795 [Alkalihalobacillus pseudalcaliphilus]
MKFNPSQEQAIFSESPFVVVSAGAGSGKTRVLTERIIYLCELKRRNPSHPMGVLLDEIVAITFTEKAAREMKERIRIRVFEKIYEARDDGEKDYWQKQKEALERTIIATFHSFCQQLLSQNAITAHLPPRIKILDEIHASEIKADIMEGLFQRPAFISLAEPFFQYLSKDSLTDYILSTYEQMREWYIGSSSIQELTPQAMLEAQLQAVKNDRQKKIEEFHMKALSLVGQFVHYSELTAAQKKHVANIERDFATLHPQLTADQYMSICSGCMPSRVDKKWMEQIPPLYELFEHEWKPLKSWWGKGQKEIGFTELEKKTLFDFLELIQQFDAKYQEQKNYLGFVDFSDLQQKAIGLLNHPDIAEACRRQYRHMMIDEFQDTNQLQLKMLHRINPEYRFIVGDTKQSIYRFRGANVSLMNQLELEAEEALDGETILMNMNYRTTEPIIETVNQLFSSVMAEKAGYAFETKYTALQAARTSQDTEKKSVELIQTTEDENQYDSLAQRLVAIVNEGQPLVHRGDQWRRPSWKDIAVLIPTRTQLMQLEQSLNNYQIPYTVYGGVAFFQRQEIIDFINFLQWLNRPYEDLYVTALLRSPLVGLTLNELLTMKELCQEGQSLAQFTYTLKNSFSTGERIYDAARTLQRWLRHYVPCLIQTTTAIYLKEMIRDIGLRDSLLIQTNGRQKVKNLEKLIGLLDEENCRLYEEMVEVIVKRKQLNEKEGEAEVERLGGDALSIMTVHASKGLEFPIVCLPQLDRRPRTDTGVIRFHSDVGIVFKLESDEEVEDTEEASIESLGYSYVKEFSQLEAMEEEKRLFYVAATRARDHLLLIGSEKYSKQSWLEMIESVNYQPDSAIKSLVEETKQSRSEMPFKPDIHSFDPIDILHKKPMLMNISVTEVVDFIYDKSKYFYKHVLGMEDGSFPQSQRFRPSIDSEENLSIPAKEFGNLMHKACEWLDQGVTEEKAVEQVLYEVASESRSDIERLLLSLLQTYNVERRQQLGVVVASEWEFELTLNDLGVILIGKIDKVVAKNEEIHLIDFKTNKFDKTGAELLEEYGPQLLLYQLAYEQLNEQKVNQASLFVFRDRGEPIHSIDYPAEKWSELKTHIKELKRRKKEAQSKSDWLRN